MAIFAKVRKVELDLIFNLIPIHVLYFKEKNRNARSYLYYVKSLIQKRLLMLALASTAILLSQYAFNIHLYRIATLYL